jgi:hypothetical protein
VPDLRNKFWLSSFLSFLKGQNMKKNPSFSTLLF